MSRAKNYPISALVGCEQLVLALVLCAIDPAIGGVLLKGEKGSAKTTAARGLADILFEAAPFVEIPLGASEDRVVGSLDLRSVLNDGEYRFQPGILSAADGGVLYIDEVNLLADHLVDVLLDVAVSGLNRVERDGISHEHRTRFVLVGSMNPEEGELRPQLLDRFGLSVDVAAPRDLTLREEALRRRMAFDSDPEAFVATWADEQESLKTRLLTTRPVPLASGLQREVARLCRDAGAQGLRADLVICRAAAALAGWEGKSVAEIEEVVAVAPMALSHRRGSPFDKTPAAGRELDELLDDLAGKASSTAKDSPDRPDHPDSPDSPGRQSGPEGVNRSRVADGPRNAESGSSEEVEHDGRGNEGLLEPNFGGVGARSREPGDADRSGPNALEPKSFGVEELEYSRRVPLRSLFDRRSISRSTQRSSGGRGARTRGIGDSDRAGRMVGTAVTLDDTRSDTPKISAVGTVVAAVSRTARLGHDIGAEKLSILPEDLRSAVFEGPVANLVIFVVDTSGSMGARERVEVAKSALIEILMNAYQKRDRVALIAVGGKRAEVVLKPTSSVEIAKARLETLSTGGRSPLAAGIELAVAMAERSRDGSHPIIVLVSDGRATWADGSVDPVQAALAAADSVGGRGIDAVVIDCEGEGGKLGISKELAERMGAHFFCAGP